MSIGSPTVSPQARATSVRVAAPAKISFRKVLHPRGCGACLRCPGAGVLRLVHMAMSSFSITPSACFFREFLFFGVEVCALLCLTLTTSAGGCLKWQLVARNCLKNLLVEHDVFRDCLMQFPCSLCGLEMTRYSHVLFQEEWMCF